MKVSREKLRIIAIALASIIVIYQCTNNTGMVDYILDMQFRFIGSSSDKLTFIIMLMIYLLPWFAVESILTKKQLLTSDKSVKWVDIIATAIILPVITAAGYFYFVSQEKEAVNAKLEKIDWSRSSAPLGADSKYVELTATVLSNINFTLSKQRNGKTSCEEHYYAIVPDNWQPTQPVNLILKTNIDAFQNRDGKYNFIKKDHNTNQQTKLNIKLERRKIPVFVKNAYAGEQIKIADDALLAESINVYEGKVVAHTKTDRTAVLGLGGAFSVIIPFSLLIGMRNDRRRSKDDGTA